MPVSSNLGYLAATLMVLSLASPASSAAEGQASLSVSASAMPDGPMLLVRIDTCDESDRRSGVFLRLERGNSTSIDSMSLRAPGPLRRLRGTVSATATGQIEYDLRLYSGVRVVVSAKGSTALSEQADPGH